MDALTKGSLYHRIQAEVQRQLQRGGLLPLKEAQLSQAFGVLDQVWKKIAAETYEELAPAIDRVWLDSIEAMRADLRTWLETVAGQDGWTPIHFEFGFGFAPDGQRDPASLPDPVSLPDGHLLHGVIDLIERSDDGKTLRVTDHKTGKDRAKEGFVVGQGEYLQPVLYGLAIEVAMGKPVLEGRFFYCTAEGGFRNVVTPLNETARERAGVVLRTIDDGIDAPFLVPAPRKDACGWCDFRAVCGPNEELRLSRKKDHAALVQLREMRSLE
jgi:CRISPR/Cas system-associated exonuclease Cas4 (RecB family)